MMKLLAEVRPREKGKVRAADPLISAIQTADLPNDQVRFLSLNGQTFVIRAAALDSIPSLHGNRIVISAPLSELTAEAERDLRRGLMISAAVLIAGVAAALFFARWITRSLDSLTVGVHRLQELDLETPLSVKSHVEEISALAVAMTKARATIRTFALYVPKELVLRIISAGRTAGRLAKQEEVTALFTDIYDFTTISEQYSPENVAAMLSEYFDVFCDVIAQHDGTIIQFLGDSVFAMWNVPTADPKHVRHACECALALRDKLESFNEVQRSRGLAVFRTRFGIHTGPAVVGNVGAKDRVQYTGMGDTVNVAVGWRASTRLLTRRSW